ncbi:MAG: TonB-dependent receptor [Bryobacteraceae bacterium]
MNKRFSLILSFLVLMPTGAFAQAVAGMGGVSGVVRDVSGAVISDASVTVSNEPKGIKRALTTNDSGVFNAPALPPAVGYRVVVEKVGFRKFDSGEFGVEVGQNVSLNLTLVVATDATTIDVTDSAPLIETTRTGNSSVVNSSQILNLPINGRRVDSFVLLTPAVVADGAFGLISFRGTAGGNSFLTDGNDTTNTFYNENGGRTRIASAISQDAVQEFEVASNGYSAEFGRASGGVVNTVTRSGTNAVHGTAYWFFRNRTLNATDRYANGFNAPEVRHQAGGSIGGAIKKDKLFYFFNTEVSRRRFPLVASITRPPLFSSTGAFIGTCNATAAQCAAALAFTKRQFQVLPRTADQNLGFGKIDWRPTDRNSVSLSMNYLDWMSPNGLQSQAVINTGGGVGGNADSTVRTRYARASWTFVGSPTVVNEVRYGWFKDRLFDQPNPALVPAETGLLSLTVQGQTNLGMADNYPRLNPTENRHQIADNLTWTTGKHTFKFGGDFMNNNDVSKRLQNRNGTFVYPTWSDFARDLTGPTGQPCFTTNAATGNTTGKCWTTFSQRFGNEQVNITTRDYSFYAQDQFRITRGLTFNYGVRYEYSQFTQPTLGNPDYLKETTTIRQPGKNWAPRAGLAYAFKDNKTVIRAGYGMFYARTPGSMINTFQFNNGVYQKNITLNSAVAADLALGPLFPTKLANIDRNPPAGTIDFAFASKDFRNPYTQQGDVTLERQLSADSSLSVGYVWSHGVQLWTVRDLNVGALGPDVTYRINDSSGAQVGSYTTPTYRLANRVDPRWRRIGQVENGGHSFYNAMVVQFRKRMKFAQVQASYTWSHALDYNQGGGSDNLTFDSFRSLYNGNYKLDKSTSTLDQRHRLVINGVHSLDLARWNEGWKKYVLNNWQLSEIITLASTQPQTTTVNVSGSAFTGAAFTGSVNGFGGSSRVPFLPAANLDIDQIKRMDARLVKIIPMTESKQLQLGFEVFNVFNRISNTAVNGQAYSLASGVFTPTAGLGAGSASQGFPDGTNARRAQVNARFTF